jgi:hypothetical protein
MPVRGFAPKTLSDRTGKYPVPWISGCHLTPENAGQPVDIRVSFDTRHGSGISCACAVGRLMIWEVN